MAVEAITAAGEAEELPTAAVVVLRTPVVAAVPTAVVRAAALSWGLVSYRLSIEMEAHSPHEWASFFGLAEHAPSNARHNSLCDEVLNEERLKDRGTFAWSVF